MPCFAFNGKMILQSKYQLARAPDGNGGLYRALQNDGILEDMKKRGVDQRYLLDSFLLKNLMFFTFLCLNKSNISQKSQIGLAEMSPIAKSGNSMLMICFDLNKTELPDLAIKGIPTCPI